MGAPEKRYDSSKQSFPRMSASFFFHDGSLVRLEPLTSRVLNLQINRVWRVWDWEDRSGTGGYAQIWG